MDEEPATTKPLAEEPVTTKPLAERLGFPKILRGSKLPEAWQTKGGAAVDVADSRSNWLPDDWGQGRQKGRHVYVDPEGVVFHHKADALAYISRKNGAEAQEARSKREYEEQPQSKKVGQPKGTRQVQTTSGQKQKQQFVRQSASKPSQQRQGSVLARMQRNLEEAEAKEAEAFEEYSKRRGETESLRLAIEYVRQSEKAVSDIAEASSSGPAKRTRTPKGSASSSASTSSSRRPSASASKKAYFPLRSQLQSKGSKVKVTIRKEKQPRKTREEQVQWLKEKLERDGYEFLPTPSGWPKDCYPDPSCFVGWLPEDWKAGKQLTCGNLWLPAYVSPAPDNKRFYHKVDVEKHLGKKLKSKLSDRLHKPRSPAQRNLLPDGARIKCGHLELKSPYIQKRCKALAGKTVQEALKSTYKDNDGKSKRYRLSDLKYDKQYKNILLEMPQV